MENYIYTKGRRVLEIKVRKEERGKKGETGNIKITGLNPTILIITLSVNMINTD